MKKQLLLLLFLLLSATGFSQECGALMTPLSIQERTNEATLIIEGKVTASNSYWDVEKKNIYTVHTVTAYKNFKGQNMTTFHVVTMGGRVDDHFQLTSSAAKLRSGMVGVFFLKDFRNRIAVAGNLYELVGAAQGVIKFDKSGTKASDIFNKYTSVEDELYPSIKRATGIPEKIIQEPATANRNMASRANPIIYSFSPLTATAGTQTVLTITGTNFGSTMGTMSFSNANDGGATYTPAADAEILSWSNTLIEVEIPYLAGTGTLQITHNDGSTHQTSVPLTIEYSHNNLDNSGTILSLSLLNVDGNGGYTFAYHTDFDSSSAKTYFEEAFGLWNCESNINFTFGSTTTTDESVLDGINVVRFDNGSELASGVLGSVTTRFSSYCPETNRVNVDEMDITWNDDTNWHYGSGSPSASQYDFKTAALHELGHAHQLGHVIDSDVVMHYSLGAGDEKYVLDQDDIDGAVYTMGIFTQSTGCGNIAMSEKLDCCDPITINSSPQDSDVGEGNTVQFTASASDYDSVQWYVSTDGGTSYSALSNDSNYSGTSSTTLTISNTPLSFDGYMYAAHFTNVCSETEVSSGATLTVITYTAIPDANFEAALEAQGYDDISGDGQVPTHLIENLTSIDVQYADISDLTGIEDFAAVEFIQVRNNNLTTLDLSANTALVSVAFRENSVTSLDVSNSPNLTQIYGAFNSLTTIDLSNNVQLYLLALRNNNISTLDLSANIALTDVNLRNNPLTNVDLRNGTNTNLTTVNLAGNSNVACIQVDDAAYSTTNWTNIGSNTSFTEGTYCRYTSIPDANFEAALEALGYDDISSDGQVPTALIETVTSLQIGENSISDLTGLEDFAALTELDLYQIGLPSIDFSNNPLLEKVSLDNNPLTSIDLSALVNLTELSLELTDITSIDVSANTALFVLDVSDNDSLNTLDVRNGNNTNFTSFDATNNPNLTCIFVDDASYSSTNWTTIDSGTTFTTTNYCRYTSIPDANFEAALEANNYDDISGDGQVPTALIENVTFLAVDNEGITDLTGIEDFAALTELNISESTIPTVDLSNNTNLQKLEAYSAGMTSLDITQNSNLEELIAYSNSLTALDLSNCTSLEYLQVYQNSLTSLDLTANTALENVEVHENQLTELNIQNGTNTNIQFFDASSNSNLSCIRVDDVAYSTTNWTDIDVQTSFSATYCRYTAIPDSNFEAALETLGYDDISGDGQVPTSSIENITSLSLSNNNIADVTGIEDFISLVNLTLQEQSFTSIDLSNNTLLEYVSFEESPVVTIDVSANTLLKTLDLNQTDVASIDLSNLTVLEDLDISSTDITTIDISNLTLLDVLNIGGTDITELDVSNNVLLTSINIRSTANLSSLDLSSCSALTDFNARFCSLTFLNMQNGNNTNVTDFDLRNSSSATCVLVDDASYSTTNWTQVSSSTSFSDTYCRYTTIPDANFEAELETLGYDDISGDGQVPTALIEVVTSLDVRSLNISDLTGIEDFAALEELYCSDNNLTSLDVSTLTNIIRLWGLANNLTTLDLSNNTALTDIRVEQNALTEVNLSNLANLTILQIDQNELTALDVSDSPLITRFRAYNNNIITIDVSNNPAIQELRVSGNALISLNIQNGNNTNISTFAADSNEFLTCILVDDASYSTTNWTGIDAQTSFSDTSCAIDYTAIPDANFETALEALGYDDISGDNQIPTAYAEAITTLDVSSSSIADLTGIEDFVALVDLDAESNNLTSLDLSTNTLLETVDIDSNELTTLTLPTNGSLLTFSSNFNENLTTIDFSGNVNLQTIQSINSGLTSVNLTGLSALTSLGLNGNSISSLDISDATSLETFVIEDNVLASIDLSNNTNLTYINLVSNALSSLDIRNQSAIEYLLFSNNTIASIDVSGQPNLLWLYASNNLLTTIDVSTNTLLEKFWITDNQLTSLDITTNTALEEFACYNNAITSLDASANTALEWFLVNDNALTSVNLQNGNNTNILLFAANNNPDLTCFVVDDATYSTTNWTSINDTSSYTETTCAEDYTIAIDVFLQGAALNPNTGEENLMRDDLRIAGLIPTTSPYSDGLTCESTVFDVTGDDAIVDWVFVELRDPTDTTVINHSRSALLQRDGDVVDVDGVSDLVFALDTEDHYIAVNHRNHLGIMTISAVTMVSGPVNNINFTDTSLNITYGSDAQTTSGMPDGVYGLWCGDANEDSGVQYSGTSPDTPNILSEILNDAGNFLSFPTYSVTGYSVNDVNMDGIIQYSGTEPDTPYILQNVLAHPSNFLSFSTYQITEQIPQGTD
ncbi:MAG: matrixin family metalloprotease [Bacteroidota bacterium]